MVRGGEGVVVRVGARGAVEEAKPPTKIKFKIFAPSVCKRGAVGMEMTMKHPDVIVIYVPDDGNFHMTGAKRTDGEWKYSAVQVLPKNELPSFLAWCRRRRMTVVDRRAEAEKIKPRMGIVTPLMVVQRGVSFETAREGMLKLHEAVIAEAMKDLAGN